MSDAVEYLQPLVTTLNDPGLMGPIQDQAESVLTEGNTDDCADLANFIADLLTKDEKAIKEQNPELYKFYEGIWYQLALKGFISFDKTSQEDFLQTNILASISHGLDPLTLTKPYFDFYLGDSEKLTNYFRSFADAFMQNEEELGSAPIEIDGKKYLPQIKFWLLEYSSSPSPSAQRGAIDRLNYANKSSNVRKLTQVQRQQLLNILKIYDFLLNPTPPQISNAQIRNVEQPEAPVEASPSIDIDERLAELKNRTQK